MRKIPTHWAAVALAIAVLFYPSADTLAATIGPPTQIGTISAAAIPETSGIVDGRATPNTFWVHNDRGDAARFFAIDHQGNLLGTFPLAAAPAGDWEDIAIGANPSGGNYLYLGDIGDNDSNRPFVSVYRTAEPTSTTSSTISADKYATANLQYPGGPRNSESLFVDPLSGDMFIITKSFSTPEIYSAPVGAFDQPVTTLTPQGLLGVALLTPTAADISPDGRHILVRNKTAAYLFERAVGQSVASALHGVGIPFTLGTESQGEAIGWAANGLGFYTTSESNGFASAPIYSYSFSANVPEPKGDLMLVVAAMSLVAVGRQHGLDEVAN